MIEEKNSLLYYLLTSPQESKRVFCKEVDDRKNIKEYTFKDLLISTNNLGKFLENREEWGKYIPIFLETSFDFLRTFFGIIAGKKVCVPIHTIANEETIDFILRKIKAKCLVVTQPWLYKKISKVKYVYTHIHTIFTTSEVIKSKALPCRHIDIYKIFNENVSYEEAYKRIETIVKNTDKEEPAEIVFTSGTTGEPKGAILNHKNIIACIVRAANHLKIHSGYRTLTFLPLSHVMAQNEVFIAIITRALVQIVGRDNLLYGLRTLKPNILVAVPRVYQAVYNGIQKKLKNKPYIKSMIDLVVKFHTKGKYSNSIFSKLIYGLFTKTIGRIITYPIRKKIGKFNLLVTAGAACPEFIYDFFEAIGLPLTNAQGLTEVSGAVIYNNPNETLKGSVGYPLKGVQVKIDEDGEILLKGDPVFSGYFEEPELNKASFTPDGWFRTGDLGRIEWIKGKPYVFLIGRKKEILVLSSGLNIPAAQIEEKLLQYDLIHQVMVVGDGKPRLAALIVPNIEYFNNNNNINLREEISKIIKEVNAQMDASEHINEFEIIHEPFTIENGMLTPTLKIRRPVVTQRYKHIICQFYNTNPTTSVG